METVNWEIVTYEPRVDNSGKDPGFEYIPQKCSVAHFATLHFCGKGGLNNTLFGSGYPGLGFLCAYW